MELRRNHHYDLVFTSLRAFLRQRLYRYRSREFIMERRRDHTLRLADSARFARKVQALENDAGAIRRNHSKWTKGRLGPWTDTELPVRISGWTFFDTEHRNHLGTFRMTLWEIHPVTRIEVLKDGVWVNLDNIP
jgi:hypothetical protein